MVPFVMTVSWSFVPLQVGSSPGWGVLLYLGMVGRFCGDDPIFGDFQSDWVPILFLNTIHWPPLSAEKIGLSPSYVVLEILGPEVNLIFHQNVFLTDFNHFVSIFP